VNKEVSALEKGILETIPNKKNAPAQKADG
jgi:hypothetical protein